MAILSPDIVATDSVSRAHFPCAPRYLPCIFFRLTLVTRAVKHSLAPTDAAIIKYGRKFTELKAALLAHATINTEITVLRIWDTVTRLGKKSNTVV